MTTYTRRSFIQDIGLGALALVSVAAASAIGQLATYPNLVPWYANLTKPWFTPPNWVFAPVWTSLYALMAFALWRLTRLPERSEGRRLAIALFFLQLVLNVTWSWMFFGLNSTMLGACNIILQLCVVLASVVAFSRIDKIAAWCFVPLVLWVSFAAILNVAVWNLNR